MAYSQRATQYPEDQRLGSSILSVADYGTSTFTDVGIGESLGWSETLTPRDGRPANGTKPKSLDGIAEQVAEVSATLWTYKLENIWKIRGKIDEYSVDSTTGERRLGTGGKCDSTPQIFKFVQKTCAKATAQDVADWVTTPTAQTVTFAEGDDIIRVLTVTFFKCSITSGDAPEQKADADGNPIWTWPFTAQAEEDETITDGTGNLFERVETVELPA